MQNLYTYFYQINTTTENDTEEYLIDFNAISELDTYLKTLPNIAPQKSTVDKILYTL